MWLLMNDGFVSVVADRQYPDMLVVRARRADHLRKLLPGTRVVKTEHTDYRWRTFVNRERFAKLMYDRIAKINYHNFKNSVPDDELHDLYAKFWADGLRYQNVPEKEQRRLKKKQKAREKLLPRTHSDYYEQFFNKK